MAENEYDAYAFNSYRDLGGTMSQDQFDLLKLEDQAFACYTLLGGVATREKFDERARGFSDYTRVIYIGGECTTIQRNNGKRLYIRSRDVAMKYFTLDYCNGDWSESERVFHAVDAVCSWT
jgi:hypothetical protein